MKMESERYSPPAFIGFMPVPLPETPADDRSPIEKLFAHLEAHEREEGQVLHDYEDAARDASDPGFRYLMGLVLEDEERHHRMSKAMADEVEQSLLWLRRNDPLPTIHPDAEARPNLLRQTR